MPTLKLVPEHNGIELYFEQIPKPYIRKKMTDNGWRWHRTKKCWFNKKSFDSQILALEICTGTLKEDNEIIEEKAQSKANSIPVYFNQIDNQGYNAEIKITKVNNDYLLESSTNFIICVDCKKYISIHANFCPFCGCTMSHISETYFREIPILIKEQRKKEQIEYNRRQEEIKNIEDEKHKKYVREIKTICEGYDIRNRVIEKLISQKISAKELQKRLQRISYYNATITVNNVDINALIILNENEIRDFCEAMIQKPISHCGGNCSICNREKCIRL